MSHNRFGELQFYSAEHHHRGQAHKHVRKPRQHDRRRTNSTHRVGVLPQSHPGLCGTLVGPSKDTRGTPVPLQRKTVGGPQPASHDNTETTRPRFAASRFGYQHGSGASLLKPQIFEAATKLDDKNTFTSPPQIHERPSESLRPDSEVEDCRCTASAI